MLVLTLSVAVRVPLACGANRDRSVHVVSPATCETQSVEPSRKSCGFAPSNSRPVTTSGTRARVRDASPSAER